MRTAAKRTHVQSRIVAFTTLLALSALQSFSPPAFSSPALSDWWNGEYASGDWGGHRQRIEERGVHFWLSYEQDFAGNVSGGDSRGVTNSGSIEFGAILDFGKLSGLPGGNTLLIRFIDRNGTDLSARRVGNFFPIQQDFGVETFMLQSLAWEHVFNLGGASGRDGALSLKFGRVAAGDDFSGSPIYGLYMTNAIDGAPKALFTTNAFSSYPGSVWGARLLYTPPGETWYAKAGVYQANDRLYTGDKHGFQWDIRDDDGVTLTSEIGYTPTHNPAYPGHYRAGAYVSFWDIPRIDGRGTEDTSYAFYFHADQTLWRSRGAPLENPDAPALTAWGVLVLAPKQSVQVMPWQISAGVSYAGLLPSRPRDKLIFGMSNGHFSTDYQTLQKNIAGEDVTGETVMELSWHFQLNRFNILQPVVQYIMNPAGVGSRANVLVLGARLRVTF